MWNYLSPGKKIGIVCGGGFGVLNPQTGAGVHFGV